MNSLITHRSDETRNDTLCHVHAVVILFLRILHPSGLQAVVKVEVAAQLVQEVQEEARKRGRGGL